MYGTRRRCAAGPVMLSVIGVEIQTPFFELYIEAARSVHCETAGSARSYLRGLKVRESRNELNNQPKDRGIDTLSLSVGI